MAEQCIEFTQADLDIRLNVTMGFVITLGVYAAPLSKAVIAENIADLMAQFSMADLASCINKVEIAEVLLDTGEIIATAEG